MKKKSIIYLVIHILCLLTIGVNAAYGSIYPITYGLEVGDVVSWGTDKYYVRPNWDVYFNSFSNYQGKSMNFTNVDDTTKGYLVVGEDQWETWVKAFGVQYSAVQSKIESKTVDSPQGKKKFAWLSNIADVCGWEVKDWDRVDRWAIYEKKSGGGGDPPPPAPAKIEITLDSPTYLTPNGNNYTQSPFVVSATVQNTGGQTANNVTVNLSLSSGLATFQNTSASLGSIAAGGYKKATWNVYAQTNQKKDRNDRVSTSVISSNAGTASRSQYINIPGLVVIFVPGMMGSNLETQDGKIAWFDVGDNDWEAMALNPDGSPVNNLKPGRPIRVIIPGAGNVYGSLLTYLTESGYNVEEFGYDWRLTNEESAKKLEKKINDIEASRVYIVAHSMGGIVSNRYISMGNAHRVNKLITIGTPYLGSVKGFYAIETGNIIPFSDTDSVQNIASRSKAAYELLPSRKYFNLNDNDPNTNTFYLSKTTVDKDGKLKTVDYTDYDTLLAYLNYGHPKLTDGFAQQGDIFQKKLQIDSSGVDTYYIIGYGIGTLGKVEEKYIYSRRNNDWVLSETKKGRLINGDKTVTFVSANRGKTIGKYQTWYAEDVEHNALTSDTNVLKQINAILTGKKENYLKTSFTLDKRSYALTINSPVEVSVYDSEGNKAGTGVSWQGIPFASYYEWEHNKFVFLREGEYDIELSAIDDGVVSFTIDYYLGDEIEKSIIFKDVPIQNGSVIKTEINESSSELVLSFDKDNDGVIDSEINATSVLTGVAALDSIYPTIDVALNGVEGNNDWYTSDVMVFLNAYDEGGSGIKTIEYKLSSSDDIHNYMGPFTINDEGISTLQSMVMDNACNTNLDTREIKLDKTAPQIESIFKEEYTYGSVVNFGESIKVSDVVSGISSCVIYYDDILITTDELLLNHDGYHTIRVVATDNAGNVNTYEKTFEVFIPATVDFKPETLNIQDDSPAVVTVYIAVSGKYSVAEILLNSVLLNGKAVPIQDPKLGYVQNPIIDYDGDGKEEFMVKFYRQDIEKIIAHGNHVPILITGKVSGITFKGIDYINVIEKNK